MKPQLPYPGGRLQAPDNGGKCNQSPCLAAGRASPGHPSGGRFVQAGIWIPDLATSTWSNRAGSCPGSVHYISGRGSELPMASDRVLPQPGQQLLPPSLGRCVIRGNEEAQMPQLLGGTTLEGSTVVVLGVLILFFYDGKSPLV